MKLTTTKIKVLFLLLFIGIAVVVLFTGNKRFVHHTLAFSSQPPGGTTGAPDEQSCSSCHGFTAGPGQFTITAPQNYTPGQTYQIVVRHQTTDTTRRRWGFELTALAGQTAAGTFSGTGGNTQAFSENGRNYVSHTTAGTFAGQANQAVWTFNWVAPATNVGTVTFYASGNQANNNGNPSGDQVYDTNAAVPPATTVVPHHVVADFDGDGKSDVSVFRPSGGNWFANRSTAGFLSAQWGAATDKPAPADYDGDDKTDLAVWREGAESTFFILNSANSTVRTVTFGTTGDVLTVGDWDGDGKADPSVYRAGTGGGQSAFFYLNSASGNTPSGLSWGIGGDLAVRGDFDGDNKFDAAVFRPASGSWFIRQSSNGALLAVQWGISTDTRVAADYDGDAKTDIAVLRNGSWFIRQSSNGNLLALNWGLGTDVPVPADYDGDAKADVAVYRNGGWFIRQSSNGNLSAQSFGASTDIAIPFTYLP